MQHVFGPVDRPDTTIMASDNCHDRRRVMLNGPWSFRKVRDGGGRREIYHGRHPAAWLIKDSLVKKHRNRRTNASAAFMAPLGELIDLGLLRCQCSSDGSQGMSC